MSRSHSKTPIIGVAKAPSDKAFKTSEHRRARRALNQIDLTEDDVPHKKQFSDPWHADKDGKHPFSPKECPELIRK
ncbi:hypothetical protein [Celeribacter baekdonensis]|uniref:hypothetical protein n=1 Tax=Celeribacter baekdonensis TaxID=875171 RepID=UPI0026EE583A|nr:hypothetical protein [Celeribacter baekdonensis]|tara:strand:+ start:1547 stop:1774 length:228 start_codon:yes stop_codon:yes gene_type:complete